MQTLQRQLVGSPTERRARADGTSLAVNSTTKPYYSRGRFYATVSGSTLTFSRGASIRLFSYQVGQAMDIAGWPSEIAQRCDTNLLQSGATNGNDEIQIQGMGISLLPQSEPTLAKILLPNCSCRIELDDASKTFHLGNPMRWPGGGGLFGQGTSRILTPPVGGGPVVDGALANGAPAITNLRSIPEAIFWTQKGEADSNLALIITVDRTVTFTMPAARVYANASPLVSALGVYTPPASTEDGTYVDLYAELTGVVRSDRSING